MQTNFSKIQLEDPDIARADGILRSCVHCGFCTATCPSYVVTGDERDSPRGRIWMIRDLLENPDADAAVASRHLDRCLSCMSCMSTCPSGVDYMHLVDIGRRQLEDRHQRSSGDRIMRRFLVSVLSRAGLAYAVLMLGWLFRPLRRILPRSLRVMLDVAPARRPRFDPVGRKDQVFKTEAGSARARVILLAGCAQRAANPEINAATIRLLNRMGVDVAVKKQARCCGALAHHTGSRRAAEDAMVTAINAWTDDMEYDNINAIIVNTSGCGTTIKDYGDYFAHDESIAEEAAMVSDKAMDITEFLEHLGMGDVEFQTEKTRGLSVAYHAACSLQHGQKITAAPKDLLRKAGFIVKDIADAHLCCGSAGTYNVLQSDIADDLKERKLKSINDADADVVAAGNLGCINQLAGSNAPVLHTVQLLDWATGGPLPPEIESKGIKSEGIESEGVEKISQD
jgi:glycolate oxidase iron-sulfur subunit